MTPQLITSDFGRAELHDQSALLFVDTGFESWQTKTDVVDGALLIGMQSGERDIFAGSTEEAETMAELYAGLTDLRGNQPVINCLAAQRGHPAVDAILTYLRSV